MKSAKAVSLIVLITIVGLAVFSGPAQNSVAANVQGDVQVGYQLIHPFFPYEYYGMNGTLYLRNSSPASVNATLDFFVNGGDTPITTTRSIPANGLLTLTPDQVPGLIPSSNYALRVEAPSPVESVFYLSRSSSDKLAGYRGIPAGSASTNLVFGPFFDTSSFVVMNLGAITANFSIDYVDTSGTVYAKGPQTIQPGDRYSIYGGSEPLLPNGFIGTAWVTSDQPLVGILAQSNHGTPEGDKSLEYSGAWTAGSTMVYVPRVLNSVLEGEKPSSTVLFVANLGASAADVTLSFYAQDGTSGPTQTYTSIAAGGSQLVDLGTAGIIPEGSTYSVKVTSTSPIAVGEYTYYDSLPNEYGNAAYMSGAANTTVELPRIIQSPSRYSVFSLQNTGAALASTAVNYYDLGGVLKDTVNLNIPVNGWQRIDLDPNGALDEFEGSVVIVSNEPVLAWVDEYSKTVYIPPVGGPDLSRSYKTVSLPNVDVGDILTYTMVLRNVDPITATATLTDPIPANTTYVTGSAIASDGGPVTLVGGDLIWSGDIISGTPVIVEFAAEVGVVPIGTAITNTAMLNNGHGVITEMQAFSVYNPGYGLTINDGIGYTDIPTVTLTFSWNAGDNITSVKISNDGGFAAAGTTDWLPVDPADPTYTDWILDTYDDLRPPRTVYIKFRDSGGTQYGPFQDDIIIDPVAPVVEGIEIITVTARIQSAHALGESVIVRVTTSDDNSGVGSVQISHQADFADYTTFKMVGETADFIWELQPSGLVYVRAVDRAGNLSTTIGAQGPKSYYKIYLPLVIKGE